MSFMEPMNAPNQVLNHDDFAQPDVVSDLTHWSDSLRPMHENTSLYSDPTTGTTTLHFSPFTSPEDIRYELRKEKERDLVTDISVHDSNTDVEPTSIVRSIKGAASSTASSISSAFRDASHWARERLNGAPHTHSLPVRKASPSAPATTIASNSIVDAAAVPVMEKGSVHDPRPLSARLPPAPAAPKVDALVLAERDAHGHVDFYDAAGHRVSDEIAGQLRAEQLRDIAAEQPKALTRPATDARTLQKVVTKPEADLRAATVHELAHTRRTVNAEMLAAQQRVERAKLTQQLSHDRSSNLAAPAFGADIDASDGLSEAGAVLGRGIVAGLLGSPLAERSATLHEVVIQPGAVATPKRSGRTTEQLEDTIRDRASNLSAPAFGADIDASDGLSEAGAVLGRGLMLGLSGNPPDRSATLHATTRSLNSATA